MTISIERQEALAPPLRGLVGFYGFREWAPAPVSRLETASSFVHLTLSFGATIRIADALHTSFVAGVSGRWAPTRHEGHQAGVQLTLAPYASRIILGVPQHELADRTVHGADALLEHLAGESFMEQLAVAASWTDRSAMLQGRLLRCSIGAQRLRSDGRARVCGRAAAGSQSWNCVASCNGVHDA